MPIYVDKNRPTVVGRFLTHPIIIVFRRLSSWLRKVVDEIIEFWTAADR